MKIRDLGKAILDFELTTIPKVAYIGICLIFGLLFNVFCWVIKTYKGLWGIILLACVIIFFYGLERNCVDWCYRLIDLYDGYAIKEGNLYLIIFLLVGLVFSFKLDKKLTSININNQNEV